VLYGCVLKNKTYQAMSVHECLLHILSNAFCQADKYQILICGFFLALLLNLSSLIDLPHDVSFIMESIVIFK